MQNVYVIYYDYKFFLSNDLWRGVKPVSHTDCAYAMFLIKRILVMVTIEAALDASYCLLIKVLRTIP